MKAYVVAHKSDDEYWLRGVFSSREIAERAKERMTAPYFGDLVVEEYVVDALPIFVRFGKNSIQAEEGASLPNVPNWTRFDNGEVHMNFWSTDTSSALTTALRVREKLVASGEWDSVPVAVRQEIPESLL